MISNARVPRSVLRYGGFVASVGGARVAGILITSVTFPFLVRRLGVETYGLWSYVVAVCAIIDIIANPGLTVYAAQQVAARRLAAADLIPDFLALRAIGGILAILTVFVFASFEVRPDVRWLLRWYGAGNIIICLSTSDFLLSSLEFFHIRSLLSVIQQALYGAGILLMVRSPKDIGWVPVSILGSTLVSSVAGWVVLWRNGFRISLAVSPSRWRGILVPSFHYGATSVMSSIYHRTGHIAVRWFLGDHALGLYAAALRLVDILRNFVNVGLSVIMPRMAVSAQSEAGMKRLVRAAVSAVASISIPLMFGTLATAHLVVPLVMGAGFAQAVGPARWMSGFVIAAPVASLLSGTILYALGRHREYFASAAAGAIAAIILYLTLVPALGLTGACLAFVLAEVAVGVAAYLLIPRELRGLWRNPVIAIAAFSSVIMVAAVKLVNRYSSSPVLVVAAGATVYLIVFGLSARKTLMQQFGSGN